MAEKKLGTGHGERLHAPTQHTEFRRASSTPVQRIAIYTRRPKYCRMRVAGIARYAAKQVLLGDARQP